VLDTPAAPVISVSPPRTHVLILEARRYPPISEVAEPMLRLAGQRINPRTNGLHGGIRYHSLTLRDLGSPRESRLASPPNARFSQPRWSPDGTRFALTNSGTSAVELWIGTAANAELGRVPNVTINAAYGEPIQWMPDSRTLLVQVIPEGRGAPPPALETPAGPVVQESAGRSGPVRTFQDLLQTPHDELLFDYYATSQLALVDSAKGTKQPVGKPGIYSSAEPSPDGKHLLVTYLKRPYSYLHTASSFPREIEIWTLDGRLVHKVASKQLADRVPIDGVPTGPRQVAWRPTEGSTLVWVEALDDGDPRKKVTHRDKLLLSKTPFTAPPVEFYRTEHRLAGLRWLEGSDLAMLSDNDRDKRWTRSILVSASKPGEPLKILWSRSQQDRYRDPGNPVSKTLGSGHQVIAQAGEWILLEGEGASPEGDRPFLDRFNVSTGVTERLFQSDAAAYEAVSAMLSFDGSRFITRRESPTKPPNYFLRARGTPPVPLTNLTDPVPELRSIRKQLVTYKRPDGVGLSFTLYLPPGYKEGTRLPTVVWAYPREYNDPEIAGQIAGSSQRFTTITGPSHLFFLLAGYAVLDGATMPVVGDSETANNTYIEQIVASAKAAIDKATQMGVTDPARVGVGGHSYGAFMTANLLAHSDLFRAGIARSGAYNRTLTPFGFQNERRTVWQAPDVYLRMSPFLVAHKINEPILLIHGEADNNSGTFPIQSERMYQAIRGNGGTVRFVVLPNESHGYAARESVEHVIAESIEWLDKHVRGAPRSQPGS
jgi:dipeptidyl aminopeptidase/acylaminoacyl peptidase